MQFFQYLGHISYVFIATLFSSHERSRLEFLLTLKGGAIIMPPLFIVAMFIGSGMALSVHVMLSRFNIQQQAMMIAQDALIHDIVPILISFILCARAALMLIEEDHPLLKNNKYDVILEWILPLIAGNLVTAILLYAYVVVALLFSIYVTFDYILELDVREYLLRLNDSLSLPLVSISVFKTLLYTFIASLIAGFYYYCIPAREMPLKHAVSKILLRGLFWLIVISGIIKFILP